jgi:hypothetical protein
VSAVPAQESFMSPSQKDTTASPDLKADTSKAAVYHSIA